MYIWKVGLHISKHYSNQFYYTCQGNTAHFFAMVAYTVQELF